MRFSSKLPPRTLYCELNSLVELTPGRVFTMSSTPPAPADGSSTVSFASSLVIADDLMDWSCTVISGSMVALTAIFTSCLRFSSVLSLTCILISSYPTNENTTFIKVSVGSFRL